MKQNYFEGEVLDLWLEDGILCGIYKTKHVDLEIAKKATQERLSFAKDKSYPVLTDYSRVKKTNKEARDYLSSEEPTKGIKAIAVIINSEMGRMIYNFFISLNKLSYPMQIFNNTEEAIKWLKQYR